MEAQKIFSTRTDQRWYAGFTAAICLSLGIAGAIGMRVWLHMPGPAVLVGGVFILTGLVMFLTPGRQGNIRLGFVDDELRIHHLDGQTYEVYAVPAGDFVCRQSFIEKNTMLGGFP